MLFLNLGFMNLWICELGCRTLMLDFIWILLVILVSCLSFISTGRCEELRRQSRRWIEEELQQGIQLNSGCRSESEDESRANKRRSQARSRRHQRRCQEVCRSHEKLSTEHCATLNAVFNRIKILHKIVKFSISARASRLDRNASVHHCISYNRIDSFVSRVLNFKLFRVLGWWIEAFETFKFCVTVCCNTVKLYQSVIIL